MMDFDYETEVIRTRALTLDYFMVPWDTTIIGRPVAEISRLEITDLDEASRDYLAFSHWCEEQEITLCSCRLPHTRLKESIFLEDRGFRFIELNYRPYLSGLQKLKLPEDELIVKPAGEQDRDLLTEMAASSFGRSRFHQDPTLGSTLGDRRYRAWMENSFSHPRQTVLKCLRGNEIVAFFVVEYPKAGDCFWSLGGLAPDLRGQGLGKRMFKTLLRRHQQEEGISTVTTSISSLNVVFFNLLVALGFRFPEPQMTFHWRPLRIPSPR